MDKIITTRLPEDFMSGLKKIAEKENLDVSTVIRKLLASAMKEWKIEYALKKYADGEFSTGEAVRFAGVSVWDFPSLLKERNIEINFDEEELEADLKTIKWKKFPKNF